MHVKHTATYHASRKHQMLSFAIRWMQPSLAIGAIIAALATGAWHRRWESSFDGSPRRGLFDGLCHLGTALAVSLPILPYVRDRWGFLRMSLLSSVVIDLDHVLAARSFRLTRCMTMEHRPASHSVLTPLIFAVLAERWKPEQHVGLAALVGVSSHLLRDLGTGGAPLLHPRRIITIPYTLVVVLLGAFSMMIRYGTRTAMGGKFVALHAWRWIAKAYRSSN